MADGYRARARLEPLPDNCTCGAGDMWSCLCGTTPADWSRAQRQAEADAQKTQEGR